MFNSSKRKFLYTPLYNFYTLFSEPNFGRSRMFSSSNYQGPMDIPLSHSMMNAPPAFVNPRSLNLPLSSSSSVPNLFANSIYLNPAPTSSQVSSCEFPTDYKPDITVYGSYARVDSKFLITLEVIKLFFQNPC